MEYHNEIIVRKVRTNAYRKKNLETEVLIRDILCNLTVMCNRIKIGKICLKIKWKNTLPESIGRQKLEFSVIVVEICDIFNVLSKKNHNHVQWIAILYLPP